MTRSPPDPTTETSEHSLGAAGKGGSVVVTCGGDELELRADTLRVGNRPGILGGRIVQFLIEVEIEQA